VPIAARNEGESHGQHAGLGNRNNPSSNNGADQCDYNLGNNTKMVLDFTEDDQAAKEK